MYAERLAALQVRSNFRSLRCTCQLWTVTSCAKLLQHQNRRTEVTTAGNILHQDAGRAFVDGYRSGLEKAKEDTLLEDLADKLWHQTAPEKRDGREADAGDQSSSGVQQAQGQSTQNHPR